jgi:hypothetical protein
MKLAYTILIFPEIEISTIRVPKSGKKKNIIILLFLIGIIIHSQEACVKAVEVPPPTIGLVSSTVYENNTSAAAVLTGIYDQIMNGTGFAGGPTSISFFGGLSADEFENYSADITTTQVYKNSLQSITQVNIWSQLYTYIYVANAAISGLSTSQGVTQPVKQQLTGEAKFIRAFLYFYAVNLYGDVPLITSTNYQINEVASRTPKAQVYQQIIADLTDAQNLLNSNYVYSDAVTVTTERTRPTKWAATALLARAYLYTENWDSAELEATSVIGNSALYGLDTLNGVFLKNSTEAIWQLQPVQTGYNTYDALYFILTAMPGTVQPGTISSYLQNAFESGDQRFADWVDSASFNGVTYYYPYKYKVGTYGAPLTEYLMVLRLGEQYLIRAEARAQLQDITDAQSDLNVIRSRAGLPNTTMNTQAGLLAAILHERQIELFSEWGHRWLDLKRTGKVDSVMSAVTPQKGGTWNSDWQLYPIVQTELLLDPNLTQNAGY